MIKTNQEIAHVRKDGYWDIRVFHRGRKGKKDPRYLYKCGCCEDKVEIYYGGDTLEIGGVMGEVYRDESVRIFVDVPDTDEHRQFFIAYKRDPEEPLSSDVI